MLLSARYVHCPRRTHRCSECGKRLGPHLYLYGAADVGEKPGPLRLCLTCTEWQHAKILAAKALAAAKAVEVAAEVKRLATWNAGAGCATPP